MEKVRKILALVVALCIAVELIVVPGGAQKVQAAVTSGNYEYVVLTDATTIRISKYTGTDEIVDIEETIDGKRVVEIGDNAFENCTNLKRVNIPNSVTNIGSYAFYQCRNLESINIPGNVKSIERYAFAICENMTGISIENGLTSIGDHAFYHCVSLTDITLPDSVTNIGNFVCEGCTGLEEISIPGNITSIDESVFEGCTGLKKITIPGSVLSIKKNAFRGCTGLSNIYYIGEREQWWEISTNEETDLTGNEQLYRTTTHCDDVTEYASGDYRYLYLDDETIMITRYSGTDSDVVLDVPEKIDGVSVTSICDGAFFNCTGLKEITIPDSVTAGIGCNAFDGCTGLTKVNLSNGITEICMQMFCGCTSLSEITIPDGVKIIEDSAFEGCIGLTKITIPSSVASIRRKAFEGCTDLNDIYYSGTIKQWREMEIDPDVKEQLLKMAIHCAELGEDTSGDYKYKILDDGNVEISKYVGDDFTKVLEIPEKIDGKDITSIGESAFRTCLNIEHIDIPDSVVSIGDYAFGDCKRLKTLHLSSSLMRMGKGVFFDCENLAEISFPSGMTDIGTYTFENCKSLTEINIPSGVTNIGDAVFYWCENLKKVNIPSGVTSIGSFTFSNCENLTDINIPSSVQSIDDVAFQGCLALTQFSIPKGVTNIERSTFSGCTNLRKIGIPLSVTNIDTQAFRNCEGLKDVYYGGTEEQWKQVQITIDQFYDYNYNDMLLNAKIHYNEELEDSYLDSSKNFRYKILDDESAGIIEYVGSDTVVDIPEKLDGRRVTDIGHAAFSDCAGLEEIVIPSGVVGIYQSAFQNCTGLKNITIPNSVEVIGSLVFAGCTSLEEITIPDSVTVIDSGAFDGCIKLKEITIPDGVKSIRSSTFSNCTSLRGITIPNSVTQIGHYVFEGCTNLKEITIPNSVTSVGFSTFRGCTALSDIYYPGTEEQWNKITVLEGNEPLQKATIHYNYSTDPDIPDEPQEEVVSAKQALESLKAGDALSLDPAFQPYLSPEQIDIMESYLYTWLAEVDYAYKYSGNNGIKERIMKKSGIDPEGGFASGKEQAITHISVETKYGQKTFEITLDLGTPDSGGNLYPAYGAMHYEVIPELPSDMPNAGQIGKSDYTDIGTFVQCVSKAAEDTLHNTYQWQLLSDEMVSGILVDKTITEIIGNKNGSFSDGIFAIYKKPLFTYSKKVTIACPVDVRVFTMDGKDSGSIVGNKKSEKDENVSLHVVGDTKMVFLSGNDYYLNLRGTDTGKMTYKVEELAKLEEVENEEVRRTVQFLELQLKKDLQYEGYVFRPLNIDSDLYALRRIDGSSKETILPKEDTYKSMFKKVQVLSLSQGGTATVDKNRSVQLNAKLYPEDASNRSLKWTTDNQSVLSVDGNGLVTAVGAGSATVTVSTKDGSFLKQYCVINVKGGSNHSGNNSGSTGGSGNNSGSSGNNTGGSGSSGNNSGNSGSSGNAGNTSADSGNSPDDFKPSLEPETPPVVVALHYVLQFQTNGGINLSRKTMTLLANDNPGIMPKIQRKGYVFDGWYTQQNGGEQVKGDEPLKAAATLYAHWTKAKAPKKLSAPKLKSKKKGQMKVAFKKVKGAAGYQLQYSTKKQFTSKKTEQLGASVKAQTVSGLKAGKKYYARVRAYSMDSMGNKMYGKYSKAKSVKIKG